MTNENTNNISIENLNHKAILKRILIAQEGSRSYSGRGMYGKQCVGIVTDSPVKFLTKLFAFITEHAEFHVDEVDKSIEFTTEEKLGLVFHVANELNSSRIETDSMGMDSIIYFKNIECTYSDFECDEDYEN